MRTDKFKRSFLIKLANRFLSSVVLALTLGSFSVSTVSAQYVEADSYLNPSLEITLGDPGYSTDVPLHTDVFQQAIDDVAAGGGGRVIVPRGTYELGPVDLRSDVHVVFDGQSILRANVTGFQPTANINLFAFGDGNGSSPGVSNVSMRSLGSPTRFIFDRFNHDRLRAFLVGDAQNFFISNFVIVDSRTRFSAVSFAWVGDTAGGTARLPIDGTVQHIRNNNAHYGFGAVQAQGGRNVEFRDIETVGGVAVRVETGFPVLNRALGAEGRRENSIDNLVTEDISCFHGQAALFLSPHTLTQGSVVARSVRGIGSELTVLIEDGSTHRHSDQTIADLGLIEGSFESIVIDGVDAVSTRGPIETRFVHLNLFRLEFHAGQSNESVYQIPDSSPVYDHPYRGPSISPILNSLRDDPNANVSITNLTFSDFLPNQEEQVNMPFPAGIRRFVPIDGIPLAGRLIGDVNDDEVWTSEDIDLLFDNLGSVTQGGIYDLANLDGVADMDDVNYLLRSILGSEFGDADLDGRVSLLDLEILANNLNQPGGWAAGDFNNDGVVDFADVGIVEQNYQVHEADQQLTFNEALAQAGLVSVRGDCNRDGEANFLDISPFVDVLSNGTFLYEADCNEDGEVNFLDIRSLIAILTGA